MINLNFKKLNIAQRIVVLGTTLFIGSITLIMYTVSSSVLVVVIAVMIFSTVWLKIASAIVLNIKKIIAKLVILVFALVIFMIVTALLSIPFQTEEYKIKMVAQKIQEEKDIEIQKKKKEKKMQEEKRLEEIEEERKRKEIQEENERRKIREHIDLEKSKQEEGRLKKEQEEEDQRQKEQKDQEDKEELERKKEMAEKEQEKQAIRNEAEKEKKVFMEKLKLGVSLSELQIALPNMWGWNEMVGTRQGYKKEGHKAWMAKTTNNSAEIIVKGETKDNLSYATITARYKGLTDTERNILGLTIQAFLETLTRDEDIKEVGGILMKRINEFEEKANPLAVTNIATEDIIRGRMYILTVDKDPMEGAFTVLIDVLHEDYYNAY